MENYFYNLSLSFGLNPDQSTLSAMSAVVVFLLIGALLAGYIFRVVAFNILKTLIRTTKTNLDDILLNDKFFRTLGWLIPPLIFYFTWDTLTTAKAEQLTLILSFVLVILILTSARLVDVLLGNIHHLFLSDPKKKTIPIAGYIQVAKVFVYLLAFVLAASELLHQDPWGIISGIGALTAVLLLVFKDSLLGLTASVQISTHNLVNLGDWIEVPAYGADGEVIDIAITQIKVKNWNHTISSIPTYALVSETFKNWRGMVESGGRRIKRALLIDMNTIRFLEEKDILRFMDLDLLKSYLENRLAEIKEANKQVIGLVNGRRLTNIGTLRAYVEAYLRKLPGIHQGFHLVVRQLEPRDSGLPLEIYCFSSLTSSVDYEALQSDIFDHLLAILPFFELQVFQIPAGRDMRSSGHEGLN